MDSLTARDALTSDWMFFAAAGTYVGCVAAYSMAPRQSRAERVYLAGVAAVPALLAVRAVALDDYATVVCWVVLMRTWVVELAEAIAPTLYPERSGRPIGGLALTALGWLVGTWPRPLEWIVGPRVPEESPPDPPSRQVRKPPGGA